MAPRVAAKLDVMVVSEVTGVLGPDLFGIGRQNAFCPQGNQNMPYARLQQLFSGLAGGRLIMDGDAGQPFGLRFVRCHVGHVL